MPPPARAMTASEGSVGVLERPLPVHARCRVGGDKVRSADHTHRLGHGSRMPPAGAASRSLAPPAGRDGQLKSSVSLPINVPEEFSSSTWTCSTVVLWKLSETNHWVFPLPGAQCSPDSSVPSWLCCAS